MKLYRREYYLQKIRGFYHDTGIIKVITGVRRCGKSCLMETISLELKENGVRDENIIYLNLDKRGFRKIKTVRNLDRVRCVCNAKRRRICKTPAVSGIRVSFSLGNARVRNGIAQGACGVEKENVPAALGNLKIRMGKMPLIASDI